ncbi:MAG: hypothetical protein ACE14S_03850 [Candidatus Bathyarchaeia archaeon]
MKLAARLQIVLLLGLVFSATYIAVFVAILFTQTQYSTPSSSALDIHGMDIKVGPPPNSTNVPVDTTITVDALATATLSDLHTTPEVALTQVNSGTTGPLTYLTTFYPAHLLTPGTSYTVSVTVMDVPVSWSFMTDAAPFNAGIRFYLATNAWWIALSTAIAATLILGLAMWLRKRKAN